MTTWGCSGAQPPEMLRFEQKLFVMKKMAKYCVCLPHSNFWSFLAVDLTKAVLRKKLLPNVVHVWFMMGKPNYDSGPIHYPT